MKSSRDSINRVISPPEIADILKVGYPTWLGGTGLHHHRRFKLGDTVKRKRYFFTGDGHWVKAGIDSGNSIQLEDDSLWQVNPVDRITCSLWLCTEEIVVAESQNPSYPYFLINTDDDEEIEAKLISD